MNEPAIQIQDLNLSLAGKGILKNLSLTVEHGEYISIIGPNGAGKTSLVKCISRIYSSWSGTVKIHGKAIKHCPQKELARQLSYVPQAEGRALPFTVFEFVLMGRYPHLSPFTSVTAADKKLVAETLEKAELMPFADRKLHTLSGGERQMVFIAAALAQGARILLLDEPTSFLDYRHQAQVMQLLGRLHRTNDFTIVAVSHDINAAYAQSNRILALKAGECQFIDTPQNVMDSARLEHLYDTPFRIANHPSGNGKMAFMEEQP